MVTALIRQSEEQPVANPPAFIARDQVQKSERLFPAAALLRHLGRSVSPRRLGRVSSGWRLDWDGDGQCADFFLERRNERIIWRDARGAP